MFVTKETNKQSNESFCPPRKNVREEKGNCGECYAGLANCLSRMREKSKVVFKKHIFIEKSNKAAYKD
jgi:hypothetical protein